MTTLRRLHPVALFERLRSTYWFLPSIVTVLAIALAVLLIHVDRTYSDAAGWLGWAYGGGAEGARALLSAVAGSIITVVSVTFSVMVVALTVSSQHFGPRMLNSFMRDNPGQLVLGTFTGTFAYCLVVLRTVQGDGDDYSRFVPHLAVTGALVLSLVSVGMLIFYVHHVATSMQVSEITQAVASDFEGSIQRLYPQRIGEDAQPQSQPAPDMPPGALIAHAPSSGYVQEIDSEEVLSLAHEHHTTIWLTARPGDFVIEGGRLACAHPVPADRRGFTHGLCRAYTIGADRTSRQDAGFAAQQLIEVALRALSPGVNEPFTAITCIDRLGQGLAQLASRWIPAAVRTDGNGAIRVVTRPQDFEGLLDASFTPIIRFGSSNPAIVERLLGTLGLLAEACHRVRDREAVRTLADRSLQAAQGESYDPSEMARVSALHARVIEVLAERPGDSDSNS